MRKCLMSPFGFDEIFGRMDSLFSMLEGDPNATVKDSHLVLSLPFPGVSKEDIAVSADPGDQTLKVTVKGRNPYEWTVCQEYDVSKVEAVYKDGLLTLTIPAVQEASASTIKVEIK